MSCEISDLKIETGGEAAVDRGGLAERRIWQGEEIFFGTHKS